jgi:electron transport complex protein RnfB
MSAVGTGAADAGTVVITAECQGCGACLLTCPEHAIRPSPRLVVLDELCTRCGECIEVCPADAVAEGPGQSNAVVLTSPTPMPRDSEVIA